MSDTDEQVDFEALIRTEPLVVLYFSGADCGVCQALWPKLEQLLEGEFPRVVRRKVDAGQERELAAQRQVFAIPSLLLYIDGREANRFTRSFSIAQVREALARPYEIIHA